MNAKRPDQSHTAQSTSLQNLGPMRSSSLGGGNRPSFMPTAQIQSGPKKSAVTLSDAKIRDINKKRKIDENDPKKPEKIQKVELKKPSEKPVATHQLSSTPLGPRQAQGPPQPLNPKQVNVNVTPISQASPPFSQPLLSNPILPTTSTNLPPRLSNPIQAEPLLPHPATSFDQISMPPSIQSAPSNLPTIPRHPEIPESLYLSQFGKPISTFFEEGVLLTPTDRQQIIRFFLDRERVANSEQPTHDPSVPPVEMKFKLYETETDNGQNKATFYLTLSSHGQWKKTKKLKKNS